MVIYGNHLIMIRMITMIMIIMLTVASTWLLSRYCMGSNSLQIDMGCIGHIFFSEP